MGIKRPIFLEQVHKSFELKTLVEILKSPIPWVFLMFLLSAKGHLEIIDTDYSVRTALAILESGSLLIEPVNSDVLEFAPVIEGTDKIYSQYGLGLPFIFLPLIALGKVLSTLGGFEPRIAIDFLLSFYNIPFAILGLCFYRSITLRLGASEARANFSILLLGITTAYWKYSVTDFSEITQACFLLGALHSVLGDSPFKWHKVSFWCALLIAIKVAYVILLPVFVAYALYENGGVPLKKRFRPILHFSCFVLPMGLLIALANQLRFGSFFETGYGSQAASFSWEYFRRDWLDYLFSTQRGIFPFNPILIAAIPGWFLFPKKHRRFLFLCLSISATWYLLVSLWISWQGGWCWGNRLLVPILPILMLPVCFMEFKKLRYKAIVSVIIFVSFFFQIVSVSIKVDEYSLLSNQFSKKTNGNMPTQLFSTSSIFLAKPFHPYSKYPASVFDSKIKGDFDLSEYESFHGYNFWQVHMLKFIGKEAGINFMGCAVVFVLVTVAGLLFACFFIFSSTKTWTLKDVAKHWDDTLDYDEINAKTDSYFRRFTDSDQLFDLRENSVVLDIDCRTGNGSAFFSKKYPSCYFKALAVSPLFQSLASKTFEIENVRGETGLFDQLPIALESDTFDAILCYETIEHMPWPDKFVGELSRLTKPGGILVLTTPNLFWEPIHLIAPLLGLHHSEGPHKMLSRNKLRRLFAKHSFVVEVERTFVLIPAGPKFLLNVGRAIEKLLPDWTLTILALRQTFVCRKSEKNV